MNADDYVNWTPPRVDPDESLGQPPDGLHRVDDNYAFLLGAALYWISLVDHAFRSILVECGDYVSDSESERRFVEEIIFRKPLIFRMKNRDVIRKLRDLCPDDAVWQRLVGGYDNLVVFQRNHFVHSHPAGINLPLFRYYVDLDNIPVVEDEIEFNFDEEKGRLSFQIAEHPKANDPVHIVWTYEVVEVYAQLLQQLFYDCASWFDENKDGLDTPPREVSIGNERNGPFLIVRSSSNLPDEKDENSHE